MKFTSARQSLADLTSLLCGVVPTRSAKQVLQNFQITGNEDGTISFCATDLEIAISCRIPVENLDAPSSVLLPATKLNAVLRDDWSDTVSISIDDSRAIIKTDNGKFDLLCNADEFPSMKEPESDSMVEIVADDFVDAIEKTSFSTAKGDTRYALNGIYVNIAKNQAEFVTSDTHRLSHVGKKIKNPADIEASAIVLTKGLTELAKLVRNEEVFRFGISEHEFTAKSDSFSLVSRLVDGQFPRYRDVIPKESNSKVTVDRMHLQRSLRLAGQLTNEETHSISMETREGNLFISGSGSDVGAGQVDMPAELEGPPISVSFNHLYVIEALRVIESDQVTFRFRDNSSPVRFEVNDFVHIIMPIRAQE